MSDAAKDTLNIHVNVQITAETLQAIVANAKRMAQQETQEMFCVDTADHVSAMISRFLEEKDFESYVRDAGNYVTPSC